MKWLFQPNTALGEIFSILPLPTCGLPCNSQSIGISLCKIQRNSNRNFESKFVQVFPLRFCTWIVSPRSSPLTPPFLGLLATSIAHLALYGVRLHVDSTAAARSARTDAMEYLEAIHAAAQRHQLPLTPTKPPR